MRRESRDFADISGRRDAVAAKSSLTRKDEGRRE